MVDDTFLVAKCLFSIGDEIKLLMPNCTYDF